MPVTKQWFTVAEAADYLRVSRRTIYKLTREGRLLTLRIGQERHRRFCKESLDRIRQPGKETRDLEGALEARAYTDPLLAQLWDNEKDAAYDRM